MAIKAAPFPNTGALGASKDVPSAKAGNIVYASFPKAEEKKPKQGLGALGVEYAGWQELEKAGKMTPALKALKDFGSAPPIESKKPVSTEKYAESLGLPASKISTLKPESLMPEIQESKIKDVWDSLYTATMSLIQTGKNAFLSAFPNMIFKTVKEGDPILPKVGLFPAVGITGFPSLSNHTEETAKISNNVNQKMLSWFNEKYQKSQQRYQGWLKDNPQLSPRPEWQKSVYQAILNGDLVLKDPGYYANIVAEAIPFTVGVMGTTLMVGYVTKNPMLALSAGFAVSTPIVSQSLQEDLVSSGATPEQAAGLTKIMGPIISAIEVISDIPVLNALGVGVFKNIFRKEVANQVVKRLTAWAAFKKGTLIFAKIEGIETIEEIVQDSLQNATVKTVDQTRGIFDGIPETALRTLISTFPLAALGGGGNIMSMTQHSIIQEAQKKGYTLEEAKAFALSGGYIGGIPEKAAAEGYESGREAFSGEALGRIIPIEEAQKALAELFNENEIDFMLRQGLIIAKDGKVAYGRSVAGLIEVVSENGMVREKTLYHEAFHQYLQQFFTQEEKSELRGFVAEYARKETGGEVSLTLKESEEMLADLFADYMAKRKTFIGRLEQFFRGILIQIKRWIGVENKIMDTFDAILAKKRPAKKIVPTGEEILKKKPEAIKEEIMMSVEELDKKAVELYIKRQGQEAYDSQEIGETLEGISQSAEDYDKAFLKRHPEIAGHQITVYHDPIAGEDWAVVDDETNKVIEIFEKGLLAQKGIILKELEPLAIEARKYKSAEEFVEAKATLFRGGEIDKTKQGIYLTTDKKYAEIFTTEERPLTKAFADVKKEFQLTADINATTGYTDMIIEAPAEYTGFIKELKAKGYDAIRSKDKRQLLVLDVNKVFTEQELIDFYTQATKGIKEIEVKEKIDLEKIYQENKAKEEAEGRPAMGGSVKITAEGSFRAPTTAEHVSQMRSHFNNFKSRIKEIISPLYFHKNAPMELRNAIRTDVVGGLNKVYESRNKNQIILWGGTEEQDKQSSIEIVKLRDQVARIKADKGNPEITLKDAEQSLAKAEQNASAEALAAAERYRILTKKYTQDLVDRGKLEDGELMEDYMRHYVIDYTPDWVFNKGIPTRLRQPFRGYLKRAGKSTKAYRVDENTILGQFLEVDHDNMIEDFIVRQSIKYDIKPKLTEEMLLHILGENKRTGKVNQVRPGRVYLYNGKRYRGFNPSMPFGRIIFPTPEGYMALGKYRKTYLIPEEVYISFREFSEKGSALFFYANRVVSYWKTMAILSHFTSFNINNIVGDTWMLLSQSPNPQRVLSEIPTVVNYLREKEPSPYLQRLDKFIKDNDIVDATYIQGELPKIRNTRNPLLYVLRKSQDFSQFRESLLRIANASYLLKEMEKGNGPRFMEYYDYLGLEGLSESEALGKVARDILVDYRWTSKTFNRLVRGLLLPFGTWYTKASLMMWRFTVRHWGKALVAFLGIPLAAALFNDRDRKIRELEGELPEFMQDRIHMILGENADGSIRVLNLQFPQDALIGTKIFSIAVNQANLVAIGKKTVKDAAIDTLKQWGIKEAKGIAYLTNFFVRFIQGIAQRKDPYDNASIYPMDPSQMGGAERLRYQMLFFIKTSVPIVSAYIRDYARGKPLDITTQKTIDRLVGLGALGINDIGKRDKVYYEGKEVEWEDYDKIKEIYGKESSLLDKMENKWVASGLYPEEFIKGEEYKKILEEMRDMYAKYVPEMKDIPVEDIAAGLGERLTNRLGNSVDSAKKWYQVQLERAKTDEEKKKLGEEYKAWRQQSLIDAIDSLSATSKEIFQMYFMK